MTIAAQTNRPYTVVDLFAGAGGLSLGFSEAGFRPILAIEVEKAAAQTYKSNLGEHVEVRRISGSEDLPPADLIVGGPPCQGFSSAGLRSRGDRRNSLVRVFAELVASNSPRLAVFENVEGFLTAEQGARVVDLLDPLIETGYNVVLRKLNAANYGVPQHRKRVIALAARDFIPEFPPPTHRAFGAPGATNVGSGLPLSPTLRDAIATLPEATGDPPGEPEDHYATTISEERLARIRALGPGQTMRDLPEHLWHDSYRRRAYRRVKDGTPTERRGGAPAGLRRLPWDEPSKAITAGARGEFVHPTADRPLTVRECARLQTFPDAFRLHGTISQKSQQIGNAVPPVLATVLARSLFQQLQEANSSSRTQRGHLFEFSVTNSNGLSPALARVIGLVETRYGLAEPTPQLNLWD